MRELSMPMQRALREIRTHPGRTWAEHDRIRLATVRALQARGLIAVSIGSKLTPTEAGRDVHLHEFEMTTHVDGCHWYLTAAVCRACGAVYTSYGERDLKSDPWSAIWMDERDETGNDVPCQRCEELKDGQRPVYQERVERRRKVAA